MNGYSLASSFLWAAIAAFVVFRADALASRWLDRKEPPPSVVPEVPEDLIAVAMSESEEWAQKQALATIRERYDALKDWNKVRVAVGVGTL